MVKVEQKQVLVLAHLQEQKMLPMGVLLKQEKKLKKRDTRDEVLTAFNGALEIFENTPDDQLTPKEQASRELVKTAKEKTLDKDKAFVVNSFKDEDGNVYRQRESIPVDDLIDFLTEKIKSGALSPDELKQYQDHRSILVRNSKDYYRLPNRSQRNKLNARVKQEYDRIRSDPRLSTGDPRGDWLLASEIITKRRELILPRKTVTPVPPEPVPVSPEPEPIPVPPEPEPIPTPTPIEEIRRDFTFARRDVDIRKRATELAEEQLRSEQRRGSALNPLNWGRKIGLRIGEEHWRQKLIQQIEKSMLANNNSFLSLDMARNAITFKDLFRKDIQKLNVDVNANRTEEQAAGSAKVEQLKTGELIAGQTVREAQGALKTMMIDKIIRPAITGGIADRAQVQQRLRDFVQNHQNDPQVQTIFGRDQTQYGKLADYFATDLLETAEVVRNDIAANKYALDQLDRVVKIQLANTDWAAETQASFNYVDKAVAWAERHRLSGFLLNPATIGAAASLATLGLTKIPALSKYAGWAVPGAGAMFGAVVAGARRNYDLKVDRAAHQVDRAYNRQIPQGAKRREALEKFAYNTASVGELLNGGGQEMLTGNARRSLQDLLALDLSNGQTANREEVARRIAEIKTRLDFSAQQNADLVTFESREQVEQGRLELIKALVQARQKLKDGDAKNPSENPSVNTADLEARFITEWNQRFTTNREQQDKAFAHFRLRNALGAAAFGGAAGLAGGLVTQEAWAVIGRGVLHQEIGATVLENLAQGRLSGTTGFAVDQTKELFNHPGNLNLSKDVVLAVSPETPNYAGRAASLLDANGHKIDTPPIHLASNGNIIVDGTFDKLPDSIKALASGPGWENHPTNSLDFNIKEDIKDMVTTGRHDTFIHGDFIIDVNSGPNGQMSMEDFPSHTRLNGFFHMVNGEPVLDVDSTFAENKQIDPAHFKVLTDKLTHDGWTLNHETVPGTPGLPLKEEFTQHSVNVDHREGYSYDKPGSQENELRLYDSKLGKTVTLDMTHMQLGYQNGLNPNPIDVQQVIKNHEAGWYFTLPSAPQDGIWVSDGVDGNWDGKLVLNPDDVNPNHIIQTSQGPIQLGEFSKMVLNQDALQKYPDGNLGTESFSRQNVFNLGENGKYGFIESGRIIQKDGVNVLQHFATIRGLSDAPPPLPPTPHDIYHLVPPGAIELIPPLPAETEVPPFIPIPFAPRHPLERMVIPLPLSSPDYPFGLERRDGGRGPAENIRQVIRTTTPRSEWEKRLKKLFPDRKPQGFEGIRSNPEGSIESGEIMSTIRESFIKTPHIYVAISGAIGDVALTTAYINGLREYAAKLGLGKKITVLAPDNIIPLLEPSAQKYGYDIVPMIRHHGINSAQEIIARNKETGAMILEFDFLPGHEAPEVELLNNEGIAVKYLFSSSIGLYPTTKAGSHRFTAYFNDLLSVPRHERTDIRPEIVLPENHKELFQEMIDKYHIDTNKDQISVVVEGSFPAKRYSLENWKKVIAQLSSTHPNTEFNILFNPKASSYSRDQLETAFTGLPGVRFISEDLPHTAILLANQQLVLSNDTGLAHIAATVEGGPPIISLHLPTAPPSIWSSNPNRHIGIMPKRSLLTNNQDSHEPEESKKWINKISPEEVIKNASRVLNSSNISPQTPSRTQQVLRGARNQVNNAAIFLDRRENLRQLGNNINNLTQELGTTVGDRTRVVRELIPGISQYINSSRAAIGTSVQGLQLGGRITELEDKLKNLATEAKTVTGDRSRVLMAEIQKTFSEYQQRVQTAVTNRAAPTNATLSAAAAIPMPATPAHRRQGPVGVLNNAAQQAVRNVVRPAATPVAAIPIPTNPPRSPGGPLHTPTGIPQQAVLAGQQPIPVPTTIPTAPEVLQSQNLVENINNQLASTAEQNVAYELTPTALSTYLEGINLPDGAKINNLNIQIVNGQVSVDGILNAKGGNSGFKALLEPAPNGQLRVVSHNINPAFRHRPFIGQIEPRIANLSQELTNYINGQIPQGWEVGGYSLDQNNNLRVNFHQKAGVDQVLQAARQLATERGISEQEALDLIRQGKA